MSIEGFEAIDFQEYCEADLIRVNKQHLDCFIPLVDTIPYKKEGNVKAYSCVIRNCLVVEATRNLIDEEPLFFSYGDLTNQDLFMRSGQADIRNVNNYLSVSLSSEIPSFKLKPDYKDSQTLEYLNSMRFLFHDGDKMTNGLISLDNELSV